MNAASGLELPEPIFVVRVVKTAETTLARGLGRHEAHELICFVRGRYDVQVSGGPWHGEAGDAFCYPAGTLHEGRMALDGTNIHVVVQWRPQPGESWPTHASRVHDRYGRLQTLLAWLEATPEQEREHRAALLHLLLCEYRALLAPEPDGTRALEPVDRVCRFMRANLTQPSVNLGTLAAVAGVTPSYLCRLFAHRHGTSPMRYLQRLRLAAAVERITHTSDTFRQIAEACVLGSASHLWSLVKREYGRSPAELRGEVHGRLRPPGDSS